MSSSCGSPRAAVALACLALSVAGNSHAAHIWSGVVNDLWGVAGNWTNGQVPGVGASALIFDGPMLNIRLNASTANLNSLHISNMKRLQNFGHVLEVTSGADAQITVTGGWDTQLFVQPVSGGGYGVRTRHLSVENDALLWMAGGRVRVLDELRLINGGSIYGHGLVEIHSNKVAAFGSPNAGPLLVREGDLRLRVTGGGTMHLPQMLDVMQTGRMLELDAPLHTPVQNVMLGSNCTLNFVQPGFMAGTLTAAPAAGQTAYVSGASLVTSGPVQVAAGGHLRVDLPVSFTAANVNTLASGSTLELTHGSHAAIFGQRTVVQHGARFLVSAEQLPPVWSGDIEVGPMGTFEVSATNEPWRMGGVLELNGFQVQRGRLAGSTPVRVTQSVMASGTGGIIDGSLRLLSGATLSIPQVPGRVFVNGSLELPTGTVTSGDGRVHVNASGTLMLGHNANVQVDVWNSGTLEIGEGTTPAYVYVNGGFTQTHLGRLMVDVAPAGLPARDILETVNEAVLAGTIEVRLAGDFEPEVGQSWQIVWAHGGVSGTFDMLSGTPGFSVQYGANNVLLVYEGLATCPADLNGDGVVDLSDLLAVLSAWGVSEQGDLNGDGLTDLSDLLIVLGNWGPCP